LSRGFQKLQTMNPLDFPFCCRESAQDIHESSNFIALCSRCIGEIAGRGKNFIARSIDSVRFVQSWTIRAGDRRKTDKRRVGSNTATMLSCKRPSSQ
jgi:hypothetical protein